MDGRGSKERRRRRRKNGSEGRKNVGVGDGGRGGR